MKGFINSTITELRKTVVSYGFLFCLIITFFLCFTSVVYYDRFGKEYTLIEILSDKQLFKAAGLTNMGVLHNSVSPYLTVFLPVLSSLPFVTVFSAERSGGNIRFIISRTGKRNYYLSKYISALISGGLAVAAGFILFSFVVLLRFEKDGGADEYFKICAGIFVYGIVSVFPAFLLSAVIRNKCILCCFPFILMHFYYTSLSKIQDHFLSSGKVDMVLKMEFLYPSELKDIMFRTESDIIIYHLVLAAAAFAFFALAMDRRLDRGE